MIDFSNLSNHDLFAGRFKIKFLKAILVIATSLLTSSCAHKDWRTADRGSSGISPAPEEHPEALVQIFAARAFRWRGYFAVHCWIATKDKGAKEYITYEVIGFRLRSTGRSVVVGPNLPDRLWYGAKPELIYELKGQNAEAAIPKIQLASASYPYHHAYRVWPGPNSNTYIAHIIRNVPELGVELPPHAIGKDWIDDGDLFGRTESGTGLQFSVLGALGLTVGLAEGVELNILGLSFGVDLWRPALKLPFVGRIGFKDAPVF